MIEIREKDKLFIAVAIPTALIVTYAFFWRGETVKKITDLERRDAILVTVEEFPFELKKQQHALKQAEEELKYEKAIPLPAMKVVCSSKATVAERELNIVNLFREAGLTVIASNGGDNAIVSDQRSVTALKATGALSEPVRREYLLLGKYPAMVHALELLNKRKQAAIVEQVTLRENDKWQVGVWL